MSVLSSGVLTEHVHCFVLSSELSSCLMLEKKEGVLSEHVQCFVLSSRQLHHSPFNSCLTVFLSLEKG